MTLPPIRATLYALTDRGRTRDHNEDTFLVADLGVTDAMRASHRAEHVIGDRGMLFLVADGMGGAAAGELASEMAAVQIHRHMIETWSSAPIVTAEGFTAFLREAVERANSALHSYAAAHPDVRGMGTTATVAGVWGDRIYLAQIGDSRGYLIREGTARQLTRDQSLTQRLVEVGELTEEEAEASERRNIILQALGPEPRVKVDLSSQALQRGDLLLICSDGLTSVARRDDLAAVASDESDVQRICEQLVTLANERGGPDNITVVAVRFDGEGLPLEATEPPGYHEFEAGSRPALQATAAFPSPAPRVPGTDSTDLGPVAERRGWPTGLILIAVASGMALIGLAVWLSR
ncbi:MAG TPA: protein phosphatase 2C domain-containing protein [Gemmatimonadales bacterium]|nr:protein phosphatase 2C domain-containing protein [Gemmatimonadales bacterium]